MIKALQIKTSMLFSLDFGSNTILSCYVFFFLIIELYILIPAASAEIVNPIADLVTPILITSKETKSKIEICAPIVGSK